MGRQGTMPIGRKGLSWPAIAVRRMLDSGEVNRDSLFEAASRALEFNEEVEKREALEEVMKDVKDVEGMLAVQEAFQIAKQERGGDDGVLWEEFLYLAGKNLGRDAADAFGKEKQFNKETDVMKGWASQEPGRVLDYYHERRDRLYDNWETKMLRQVIGPVVLGDPLAAESSMSALSEEEQLICLGNFCSALTQVEGVDGLMDYYQDLVSREGGEESKLVTGSRKEVLERIAVAARAGGGAETCLERVREINQITPLEAREFGEIAKGLKGTNGAAYQLEFLDGINQDLAVSGEDLQTAIEISFSAGLNKKRTAQLEEWINTNPNSAMVPGLQTVLGQ